MHAPVKFWEKGLSICANGVWGVLQWVYRVRQNPSFTPKWANHPLPKSYEKTKPTLGWPRETDSLCPSCVRQARQDVLDGRAELATLLADRVGEIKATILERDGRILMVKDCPTHGHFEDVLSIDPTFTRHIEEMFQGRDIRAHEDAALHHHGSSTVLHGRGAVLTVDLTNRCNMMCDPCFTDANQVGYVHELTWEQIKTILDNAASIKPKRQMSVQFSGGEPTLSPHFLDAVRYARQLGYNSVQAATNGIEFAMRPEFCREAAAAGLRYVYLQFDGVGNAANSHRHVSNLFDVKLQAIENLHAAGVDIVPVVTIINGVNNEQVGRIIQFAIDNPKKLSFLSFQPVSFTGRDEEVSDERRAAQRYTLAHLAHDVKDQTGFGEPSRDWFPISMISTFAEWSDVTKGPGVPFGQLSCSCHPDCGAATALVIDKETHDVAPVPAFLNVQRLSRDIALINDANRGKRWAVFGAAVAILRNYDSFGAPPRFRLRDIWAKFDKAFGATRKDYGRVTGDRTMADIERRRSDAWAFIFIAGMWFQDLFTYDFRRTEMCIIPYGTEDGEISFCAYNTGIGWRQILEQRYKQATVSQWYERHGRHRIYAGDHFVPIGALRHSLTVDPNATDAAAQTDLDAKGVAKTAREEKRNSRIQGAGQLPRAGLEGGQA
jgi:7,8-dihydro-6-hydroxymethylpterin dimethyltransferase